MTYLTRYKEVQGKRRAMEAAVAEAEANRGGESDDEGALLPSTTTLTTARATPLGVSGLSAYTSTSTITGRGGSSSSDSSSNSSIAASTVGGRAGRGGSGGRRAETKRAKAERRGRRRGLRAGGAHEEEGLATLLVSLRPSDDALSSAGQLSELLVMLGHEQDAAALQVAMAELASSSSAAGDFVAASPPKVVESERQGRDKEKKEERLRAAVEVGRASPDGDDVERDFGFGQRRGRFWGVLWVGPRFEQERSGGRRRGRTKTTAEACSLDDDEKEKNKN